MTAIVCLILTAAGGYFSFGLGNAWWLAWLTPVPVLWLAFGETRSWKVFLAAWVASALGLTNLLRAYFHVFPGPVVALELLVPSLLFALATMGARRVNTALGAVPAMFAFAALWASFDLVVSFDPGVGSITSPAIAEVAAPMLIQSAALVGFVGITFLLGTVAAGIAISLRRRNPAPLLIAAGLFAVNAAYGYLRISQPSTGAMSVALINSNTYGYWVDSIHAGTSIEQSALEAIDAYAAKIRRLSPGQVRLVVLPENIARIDPAWHDEASLKLAAAADATRATVVGGFNAVIEGARRNMALSFEPGVSTPVIYQKRHLVPHVESDVFTPGSVPRMLSNGVEPEICFDMDFPRTIRHDVVAMQPRLLAVSASEIGTHGDWLNLGSAADDWFHARDAVMRSVENGVPMARAAGRGLLTLSDRYGRIVAEKRTSEAFTTLAGNLPLDGQGGSTLYDRIGDAFGWLCLMLGGGLVAASSARRARRRTLNEMVPTALQEITMTHETASTEIRALLEAWAAAVRRHDLPAILALHAPDIVMFDLPPPLQAKGLEDYKQTWDLFFQYHKVSQAFDFEELSIVGGDDVGFAFGIMRCGAGRDPAGFQFRVTIGLSKIKGAWSVEHEHHSLPAVDG